MILQLQSDPIINGSISANWLMGLMVLIIGSLLVAFMSNINKNNTEAMNSIKDEIKNLHKKVEDGREDHNDLRGQHIALSSEVKSIRGQLPSQHRQFRSE